MFGDVLHDGDDLTLLKRRVERVVTNKVRLSALRDQLKAEILSKENEIQDLGQEVEVLSKVLELYRVLTNQMVEKHVSLVEKVSTQGLQSVFYDRDLSLEAEVDFKRNNVSVELFFRKGDKDHALSYTGEPLESFGGGPASLVSFILRVLAVKKLGLYPLFVLDESMAAVADKYIPLTSQFIRKMTESLGLNLLLVTHKAAFVESAHAYYDCDSIQGSDELESCTFKRVLTDNAMVRSLSEKSK